MKKGQDSNYEFMIQADFLSSKAKKAFLHVPYTAIYPDDGADGGQDRTCMEGVIDEFGNYFSFNEPYGYFMDTLLPEEG